MTALATLHARLGLTRNPFPTTPDASSYFFTAELQTHFDEILHCIEARKGFVLLTGEVGLGKSTLVRRLLDTLPPASTCSALVFNTFLQRGALLSAVLRDFGLEPAEDMDTALARLNMFLLAQRQDGRTCVLVIDDAQNLEPESLELVRLLCNLETDQEKLLQILLSGQPELEARLATPELRQLDSRIVKRARLTGLREPDVQRYFEMRITAAGAEGRVGMLPGAARLLYRATRGNLRRIHLLLDRCLYGLAAQGGGTIDRGLMRRAIEDTQLGRSFVWRGWTAIRALSVLCGVGAVAVGVAAMAGVWRPTEATMGTTPLLAPVAARAGVPEPIASAAPAAPSLPAAPATPVALSPTAAGDATIAAIVATAPSAGAAAAADTGERRCLEAVSAQPGDAAVIGRRLPVGVAGRLKETPDLCLYQRGDARWAVWRDNVSPEILAASTPSGAVVRLQHALMRLGALKDSPADGLLGPLTIAALGNFQNTLGLPVTVRPDSLTAMLLQRLDLRTTEGAPAHE